MFLNAFTEARPFVLVASIWLLPAPDTARAGPDSAPSPHEIVLVEPAAVTDQNLADWKKEGFKGVAVVLDESHEEAAYSKAAQVTLEAKLDLFYWIEVGRNPQMAAAHPEWMASLGMHDDWQKRFPKAALPKKGEVAKAFPWVPITYQEAFEAHLVRINRLLELVPKEYRGLLLNDLQVGPASCGCGNLQCRWATDYQVPATATPLVGSDIAARFVTAVRQRTGAKAIIPVWTTECEDVDLPADKRADGKSTGYCGAVACHHGLCPIEFAKQWEALDKSHQGPIALLALHREFERARPEYGGGAGWVKAAVEYLGKIPVQEGNISLAKDRLWLVVQGYDCSSDEEKAARQAAVKAGAGVVVVARTRIDQSYEPRLVRVPGHR
ncbi:MAG: hypothetical protein HY674_09040 [Chloroflexi bacterium]|nr:hypothetical protein [Chloroflexota bacterium]